MIQAAGTVEIPAICFFGGLASLIGGLVLKRLLSKSKSWPKTVGKIVEASIEPGWTQAGGSRLYVVRPKVVYKYMVGNTVYTSSQLALIESNTANEQEARSKASKYSAGQLVDVYYNPKKPDFAVLTVGDPTQGKFPWAMIIIGIIAVVGAIIWAYRAGNL